MGKANGFIRIDRDLWRSEAVENLSPLAKLVLVELFYGHTGHNNGKIMLSYESVRRRLKCSHTTVWRTFNELHRAGLIETVVNGSFSHKEGARRGTASQYRLTFLN